MDNAQNIIKFAKLKIILGLNVYNIYFGKKQGLRRWMPGIAIVDTMSLVHMELTVTFCEEILRVDIGILVK